MRLTVNNIECKIHSALMYIIIQNNTKTGSHCKVPNKLYLFDNSNFKIGHPKL